MLAATNGRIIKGYLPSRYGQLHYRYIAPAAGDVAGLPVLLFGAAPMSGGSLTEMLRAIGRDRTALVFDTPGYGESDRPPAPLQSAPAYAEIFLDGLDQLGVGRFNAFGDHSGAMLAFGVAATAPDRVDRLVISATPFMADQAERAKWASRWPAPTTLDPLIENERGKWKRFVESRPAELALDRAVEIYADSLAPGVYAQWMVLTAFSPDTETWLSGLTTPVRFLQTDDWLTERNLDVAKIIANASFKDRRDLDYFAYYTKADEIAAEIREFCDAETPAGDPAISP